MKHDDLIKRLAETLAVKKLTSSLDKRGIGYEIIPIQHLEGGVFGDFKIDIDIKKEEK